MLVAEYVLLLPLLLTLQLGKAFRRAESQAVHDALADMIFLEGLPMRLVKSKYLRKFIGALSSHVEHNLVACAKAKIVKGRPRRQQCCACAEQQQHQQPCLLLLLSS